MVSVKKLSKNFSIVLEVLRYNPGMAFNLIGSYLQKIKAEQIDYRRPSGKTNSLSLIYMRITPLCNLHCVTCGQRGVKGVLKGTYAAEEAKKIVPPEDYVRFIDEVAVKKPVFYIWGGEPFMYPHIMEVARHIVRRGCVMSINTNGTLLTRHAEQIVRDRWSALFISLDSFEEENDRIRGKGSYRKVIESLEALKREKKRQHSQLPHVGIVTVVSRLNYRSLDKLINAMGDKGLSWHIINLGTYTNDTIIERQREFMKKNLDTDIYALEGFNSGFNEGIDGEEFQNILKRVHSMNHRYPIVTVPVIRSSRIGEYYAHLETLVRDTCRIPWSQADIDYNGNVHFCADYPEYVLGNIREQPFFEIFNNERARTFRKTLKSTPRGLFPGCVRCYQNMLFGKRRPGY